MTLSPQKLLALGPIPRRLAPSIEELVELWLTLEAGVLGCTGVFDRAELDAALEAA